MRFHINDLIYIYMLLLGCMFAYNVFYIFQRRFRNRRLETNTHKWVQCLYEIAEGHAPAKVGKRIKRMKNPEHLEAFQLAADTMPEKNEIILQWVYENSRFFDELIPVYRKKGVVYKAYFAFFITRFHLVRNDKVMLRYIQEILTEQSVYCRENGLQALYASGKAEEIVKAFEILSRNEIVHNNKLVTDGLLEYSGDPMELSGRIWKMWDVFLVGYKVAFIDYFRIKGCIYNEKILELMKDSRQDRDIRFACTRYFRKISYEPAADVLRSTVRNWTDEDWEFPAVSASSLVNYPGDETVDVLIEGVQSRNWYIRHNCAESLLILEEDDEKLHRILLGQDKFAKEIMEYKREAAWKEKERNRRLGGENADDGFN